MTIALLPDRSHDTMQAAANSRLRAERLAQQLMKIASELQPRARRLVKAAEKLAGQRRGCALEWCDSLASLLGNAALTARMLSPGLQAAGGRERVTLADHSASLDSASR